MRRAGKGPQARWLKADSDSKFLFSFIIEDWKFVKRDAGRVFALHRIWVNTPDQSKSYGVLAFSAPWKLLVPQESNFMRKAMFAVDDLVNSALGNPFTCPKSGP